MSPGVSQPFSAPLTGLQSGRGIRYSHQYFSRPDRTFLWTGVRKSELFSTANTFLRKHTLEGYCLRSGVPMKCLGLNISWHPRSSLNWCVITRYFQVAECPVSWSVGHCVALWDSRSHLPGGQFSRVSLTSRNHSRCPSDTSIHHHHQISRISREQIYF